MANAIQDVKYAFSDLKNIMKLFDGNDKVISEQIDLTIYCLNILKQEIKNKNLGA
jgi:hypothetical protein